MRSTPLRVEIESELAPIVPEFLENRGKDCQRITDLLAEQNFSEIRTLGHRMKGAGGSYGFDEISEIGETIEHAALAGDPQPIIRAVAQLAAYLGRVEVTYV